MSEVIERGDVEVADREPVTTGPSQLATANPFTERAPDHISAGSVAIESRRAAAEVQGRMIIAKQFPRDTATAYAKSMEACRRPGLANEALYSYRRGALVEGPSIRLAEELARHWGNIEYGINELSRRPGESEMEAFAWDLETNTRSSQRFTVRHIRDKNEGGKALETERDIYEITANMGARRVRSRILAILPPEVVTDAILTCKHTIKNGGGQTLDDRIREMIRAFGHLDVSTSMIAARVGHAVDKITPDELVELRGIYQSVRDGASKVRDWFGPKVQVPAGEGADQFEKASAGQIEQTGGTQKQEEKKPEPEDPDIKRAHNFLADLSKADDSGRLALQRNPSWAKLLAALDDKAPELKQQLVDAMVGKGQAAANGGGE